MKVMLDTNIILDVWLARKPYWENSASLLAKVENKKLTGYLCPTTITTLHYLGRKALGENKIRSLLKLLLNICKVGQMSSKVFEIALSSDVKDFEDAVVEAVSIKCGVDLIITRNVKDFKYSKIPAKEPGYLL